ncbi:MAG: dihydropteroate synthase [Campylobacterota bacterium]|nr:dihydropteroate synthase [Campylobacterota bacterium]
MDIERLSCSLHVKRVLQELGVDGGGISILASKMKLHFFYIRALHVGGANILKQDALSIGADLAVPKGTVLATTSHVDAILIANTKQLKELSRKELAQPFGLKNLALELQIFLKAYHPKTPKVMGIINANDDSFYALSRFRDKEALHVIINMIEEGADIIDIGGVSSRPGSVSVSADEELQRVKPIIDLLHEQNVYDSASLSIDSYTPSVVEYALDKGFGIVNDITGLQDDAICELCSQYSATAVIMHMQGTPQIMQNSPSYEAVISEVSSFFQERIEKAKHFSIENLILDVGIGFGKRLEDNIALIAQLEHFLKLGYPLLVGASRKSMIDAIYPSMTEERLGGSLALHVKAIENGAEIIRVHDVKEHVQALKVWQALSR